MKKTTSLLDGLLAAAQAGIEKAREAVGQIDWVEIELGSLTIARDHLTATLEDEHAYDLLPDGIASGIRVKDQKALDTINARIAQLEAERDQVADTETTENDTTPPRGDKEPARHTVHVRALIEVDVEVENAATATRSDVLRSLHSVLSPQVKVRAAVLTDSEVA
jgi:hypothetical protein